MEALATVEVGELEVGELAASWSGPASEVKVGMRLHEGMEGVVHEDEMGGVALSTSDVETGLDEG